MRYVLAQLICKNSKNACFNGDCLVSKQINQLLDVLVFKIAQTQKIEYFLESKTKYNSLDAI